MEEDKSSGPFSALKLLPTTVTREELIQRQNPGNHGHGDGETPSQK